MTKVLFIVTERHTLSSLKKIINYADRASVTYKVFYLPNIKDSILLRIFNSFKNFNYIQSELTKLPHEWFNNTTIIYSTSEGFLLSNKKKWLPKLTDCKEIMIQHGVMPTKPTNRIKRILAYPYYLLTGIRLVGNGFGGNKCDKIIVYGNIYKDFLVKYHHWDTDRIIVCGSILKDLYPNNKIFNNNACLFLLQDLSSFIGEEQFKDLSIQIIKTLLKKYSVVYLRKHPKMRQNIHLWIRDLKNVVITNATLEEDLGLAPIVYSFISTSLVDASIVGRNVIAIKISVFDSSLYKSFNCVVSLDQLENESKECIESGEMRINPEYFKICNSNSEFDLFRKIL